MAKATSRATTTSRTPRKVTLCVSPASETHPIPTHTIPSLFLKTTENGAAALSSTLNPLLDFFATSGALRTRTENDIYALFSAAFAHDPTNALRALFYARDIRFGGQGERRTFRAIASRLAVDHPEAMARNLRFIPKYGRFDDLYAFVGTPLETAAFALIANQWNTDVDALSPGGDPASLSLLAKWLKSENASSPQTRALATLTRQYLGLSSRDYRKALSAFRSALRITETALSSQAYTTIDYSAVPSLAHKKYRAAFRRHDPDGYSAYLADLSSPTPTTKINAGTLFPYDLVRPYITDDAYYSHSAYSRRVAEAHIDPTIEAQWKALPDYLADGTNDSFLVMADTSGSMIPGPIATSVGLAVYFAEHAHGPFKNHFITFTSNPRLVEIPSAPDTTLFEKVYKVLDPNYVGYSTNLEAAFDLVLKSAIKAHVPQSDMPSAIVIISDMEIDEATESDRYDSRKKPTSFTTKMAKRFKDAGYKMPKLVYWNVEARQQTFHATANDNVRFVSGQSAAVFETLCENLDAFSAEEMMMRVLEKYAEIM